MARGFGAKRKRAPAKEGEGLVEEVEGDVLGIDIDSEVVKNEVAKEFQESKPYRHCVLKELCNEKVLRKVRDEIITNLRATFKETDIYKVLQTGDLANLDGLDKNSLGQLPHLKRLRDTIYSKEFRTFVESVAGLGSGELIDKTDCSCNIYPQGGHLLCHDDVIGTRKVSYIIYLTDPDSPWKSEDGGALALYDCIVDPKGKARKLPLPDYHPIKRLLPTWNTMVMFAVQPGKSFHDIEEVIVTDKPRLSISGWFHGEKPPEGSENATLNQILVNSKSSEWKGDSPCAAFDKVDPFVKLPSEVHADGWLSESEVEGLALYINPQYLVKSSVERIADKFVDDSHIQLYKFLNDALVDQLSKQIHDKDEEEGMFEGVIPPYESGVGGAWKMRGPTHKQRYLEMTCDAGGDLFSNLKECFGSPAFQKLLSYMTKVTLTSSRSCVRRFRPGLDYTLAHSGVETAGYQLDATLCMVEESEQWGLGEVGGYDCYMVNDIEAKGPNNASAEVYNEAADEDDETVTLPATNNCLNLVLSCEGVMRFTKYISATAPGSRWDIMNEFEITPDDDSDEDE
ncbi:oxoglutarate/iron-dependent oxygenase [Chloropicon primus]|uniref:Oxoglutarate/iron-dependent oxygenase n=1 Tax=Chloropicon primus TaxID=1764295 RepID=A0A5B8MII8_9CHLO|nr:oxoglutarate/iron-dependent oxygenase [Chloropicon primus]|mmetsp:Transcript_14372/g.40881  ORF Transcript_14372/g.40881 Transcript_14372/m.40881 type:complete len:569 (-) Transcript_14372:47-1753(-)|eukprot:QDZ20296.1 oxoglutarate/iron-dependent oxygenase [Chloropicon primus]